MLYLFYYAFIMEPLQFILELLYQVLILFLVDIIHHKNIVIIVIIKGMLL